MDPFIPFMFGMMGFLFPLMIVIFLWAIVLKGFALWHAARNGQKEWFVILLVINTLGILEIVYLVWFRTPTTTKHASRTPSREPSAKV